MDLAWSKTNANIENKTNKGIEIIETKELDGSTTTSWKLLYEAKEKLDDPFFGKLPKLEIATLLKFIGDRTELWSGFTHIKHKYIKRKKPNIIAIIACILAKAFGLNIKQMYEQ